MTSGPDNPRDLTLLQFKHYLAPVQALPGPAGPDQHLPGRRQHQGTDSATTDGHRPPSRPDRRASPDPGTMTVMATNKYEGSCAHCERRVPADDTHAPSRTARHPAFRRTPHPGTPAGHSARKPRCCTSGRAAPASRQSTTARLPPPLREGGCARQDRIPSTYPPPDARRPACSGEARLSLPAPLPPHHDPRTLTKRTKPPHQPEPMSCTPHGNAMNGARHLLPARSPALDDSPSARLYRAADPGVTSQRQPAAPSPARAPPPRSGTPTTARAPWSSSTVPGYGGRQATDPRVCRAAAPDARQAWRVRPRSGTARAPLPAVRAQ
ncbi:hypothetical protein BX283_7789 [Streptomyces sp. TLI_146]|nr:hypothetical protein BX283_7789 [Streptomyces sp. TLI_146]